MAANGGHAGTKKGPNWGHVTGAFLNVRMVVLQAAFLLSGA